MTVVLPQSFNQALFGATDEGLHCVRDVQCLQLRDKDVTLQVISAGEYKNKTPKLLGIW